MATTCASCGTPAAADARFCSSCGSALTQTCTACGAEQAPEAAFCSACGTSLRPEPPLQRAASDEERKVVTVLFADLVGSTALADRLDPEDVRELQRAFFALVGGEVERFG